MPTGEAASVIEIRPPKGLIRLDLAELWRYRELLHAFVERNIKVRYKQTAIGVAWAVFQPFVTMVIFTLFFGRLAKVPSDGIPYPVFVYAGLLFWNLFSAALTGTADSMVAAGGLIKKVYFPRLLAPLSAMLTPVIDFAISLLVLFGLMAYYGYRPGWLGLAFIPALALATCLATFGLGLFLAALNVKYRDVRYVLPFFIQMLLFLTPVIYPVSLIPERFRWLIMFNPMSGVINVARSSLLGTGAVPWTDLLVSVTVALVLLLAGLAYFRKTERFFADIA
jgi:lipopolysaccharide transport system permease protein